MSTVERERRKALAAASMRVDQVTGEVVTALRQAGVRPLLLKGPAVASWLYGPGELRSYCDLDLLVCGDHGPLAEQTLAGLGFKRGQAGWREISRAWTREHDTVDMHRSLLGVGVDDDAAWARLSLSTEPLRVGRCGVEMLAVDARALHVALHAAQHGDDAHQPLVDLARALEVVDIETWGRALELARALSAEGAFASGLRQLYAGAAVADGLGATPNRPAAVALRSGSPPPAALGVALLAEAGGTRARLKVLARGIAPPPDYMRRWSTLAARGRVGLVLAYPWRWLWLICRTPAALAAWYRARREERAG